MWEVYKEDNHLFSKWNQDLFFIGCSKIRTGRNSHVSFPHIMPEWIIIYWISQPLPIKKKPVTKSIVPILTLYFLSSNNRCLFMTLTLEASKYCYSSTAPPLICPGNFSIHWIEAKRVLAMAGTLCSVRESNTTLVTFGPRLQKVWILLKLNVPMCPRGRCRYPWARYSLHWPRGRTCTTWSSITDLNSEPLWYPLLRFTFCQGSLEANRSVVL